MTDIFLKQQEDGPDFKILSTGLPQMTGGLDNFIYLLLFQGDWWGNELAGKSGKLSSHLLEIIATSTLTNQTRLNVIEEAKKLLIPMTDSGLADSFKVAAEIPGKGVMYLSVRVYEPDMSEGQLFVYGLNWDSQKIQFQED